MNTVTEVTAATDQTMTAITTETITGTGLNPDTSDLATMAPTAAANREPAHLPGRELKEITVVLVTGAVQFSGRLVDRIPPFTDDPTLDISDWPAVYLTGLGQVAVHDPHHHRLDVYPLAKFVSMLCDSPASYIVDEVLEVAYRATGQPATHLDI